MTIDTIDLEKHFAKKLGMRNTAKKIFKDIEEKDSVNLDFKNIKFMSRSFAQEYVYQKHNSSVKINELNKSDFIIGLLEIVEMDYNELCLKK